MLDPTSQVTVGGSLLLVIFMLLKFKPWERKSNANGASHQSHATNSQAPRMATSGEQNVDYWKHEIEEAVRRTIESQFKSRNEEIRKIVREELSRRRGQ